MAGKDIEQELRLEDTVEGLGAEEVQKRRAEFGFNEIPAQKVSFLVRFGRRFWGIVPWMLEATAFFTFLLGKYPDAAIIVGLLLFNAAISLWREGKAKAAMASLKQRLMIQSRVKRDGRWSVIPARELVPGDRVRVRTGDLVPADLRLVDGSLDVDQSALTGESVAVARSGGETVYSGSAVKRGEATSIVSATGARTYFGKTVELLELSKPKLHMEAITVKVARRLALMVVAAVLASFTYALLTGFQLAFLLPLTTVLLVAAVPVAMPTMFTLNMTLGSSVLAREGVLVTRLSASEDAAAMDVLCVDKTGTITMNKLFVEDMVPGNGFSKEDVLVFGSLASKEANQDPIDSAFITAAAEAHLPVGAFHQVTFTPFDVKTRMTEAEVRRSDETFFVRKGSVEAVCSSCEMAGEDMVSATREAEELSAKGLRAIAVAKGSSQDKMRFVGLAGVADRIREDSRETVSQIRALGISTKMLTGDALPIARNIAKQVGLGDRICSMPVTGERTPPSMVDCDGVAGIYPEDKYMIVKALQDAGHVVGMTGDGVNDAPALNQSEVGIAVSNATDIAKESSSAVLTAGGLAGIVSMVKTGRAIFQRLYSWVLNMITKKTQIVGYIVAMLFLTRDFVMSILGMVLLLFLGDFATMSISTDNVRYSQTPDSFEVQQLFVVGGTLGLLTAIEGVVLTLASLSYFGLNADAGKLYTFGFAYLVISGLFNLFVVRERRRFWSSRPSNAMVITLIAEILFVTIISLLGFLELFPLGYVPLLAIFAYAAAVTFLINDSVKVHLLSRFTALQR